MSGWLVCERSMDVAVASVVYDLNAQCETSSDRALAVMGAGRL